MTRVTFHHFRSLDRFGDAHRQSVANRENRKIGLDDTGDQLQIERQRGIAAVIEIAVGRIENKPVRRAAISPVGEAARMLRNHTFAKPKSKRNCPPGLIRCAFWTPIPVKYWYSSQLPSTLAPVFLAIRATSVMWSKWAWETKM